MRKTEVRIMTV